MKKYLAVAVVAALPFQAMAQTEPPQSAAPAEDRGGSFGKTVAITLGIVGGVVAADLLIGGSLTGPILEGLGLRAATVPAAAAAGPVVLTPAVQEARAAGAVIGELITPATRARDVAARRDVARVVSLGLGGIIGGWLASHLH